jgi:PadR family transcriptional regulator PadR
VARRLAEVGVGEVKGGTLYPLLGRLEERGLVVADWEPGEGGPPRKRYALSATGRRHLADEAAGWRSLAAGVHRLLADAGSDPPAAPPTRMEAAR